MPGWRSRAAAGSRCSIPTTRSIPDRLARMIRRAEEAGAEIAVDNLDVVQETTGRRENDVFRRRCCESLPELDAGRFHRRQPDVRGDLLLRLHEADLRAAVPGAACAALRRDAAHRRGLHLARLGAGEGRALRRRAERRLCLPRPRRARSRACSSCTMSRRCSPPTRPSSATTRSMPRAQRRAGAAHAQPGGGGVVPGAGPAPQGPRAAEGGRRRAARPGRRVRHLGMPIAARLRRLAPVRSNARAFDQTGIAIGENEPELGGRLDLNTGMVT